MSEEGRGSAVLLGDDVGEMRLVKPDLIATIVAEVQRPRGAKTTSLAVTESRPLGGHLGEGCNPECPRDQESRLTARKKGLPEPLAPTPSAAKLPIVLAAHAAIRPAAPTHGFRIADDDFRFFRILPRNALGLTVRVVLVA